MSSENSENQTAAPNAKQIELQCFDKEQQERDKRLRQLANVFIDMFVASRTGLNSSLRLVN